MATADGAAVATPDGQTGVAPQPAKFIFPIPHESVAGSQPIAKIERPKRECEIHRAATGARNRTGRMSLAGSKPQQIDGRLLVQDR